MRLLVLFAIALLVAAPAKPPGSSRVSFGVRVAMGMNSETTTFIAIRYSAEGLMRDRRIMRKDEFIRVLAGYWPSPFNPQKINYFEREKVYGGAWRNDTINQDVVICPILDSLWKLRFSHYPFRGGNEDGWSYELYKPSLKQEKYLADRYHFKHLDLDYIVDTNFWKLMRDVSDRDWVAQYKAIK